MDYFKILNLNKEPFSNSPDPEFFYESSQHVGCLQKLELSLRLRRGLIVVMGNVGTGKTTLCRQLIRKFAREKETVETHLLLDPGFTTPLEFLTTIAKMLGESVPESLTTEWQLKERIKNYLFRRGVDEKKIVILIIDEGQKIPDFCLEILREFLNYETNEHKLLQVVLFAQKEFDERLKKHANFADRISLYYYLGPLCFRETRSMIQFRLAKAGKDEMSPGIFTFVGLWAIYQITGGYPRKIVNLCNRVLLTLIIQNQSRAGWMLIRSTAQRVFPLQKKRWPRAATLTSLVVLILLPVLAHNRWGLFHITNASNIVMPFKKPADKISHEINPVSKPLLKNTSFISKTSTRKKEIDKADLMPSSTSLPGSNQKEASELEQVVSPSRLNSSVPDFSAESNTPPDTPHQDLTKTIPETDNFPEFIGVLTVESQDTVSDMIHKVYGVFNDRYLKSVIEANKTIYNINFLNVGDVINFPSIKLEDNPFPQKGFWVQLTLKNDLKETILFLKNYPHYALPVQVIPYWNKKTGLRFAVLLNRNFQDKLSAIEGMGAVPPNLKSEAKILTQWEKGTTFFAGLN